MQDSNTLLTLWLRVCVHRGQCAPRIKPSCNWTHICTRRNGTWSKQLPLLCVGGAQVLCPQAGDPACAPVLPVLSLRDVSPGSAEFVRRVPSAPRDSYSVFFVRFLNTLASAFSFTVETRSLAASLGFIC